MRACPSSPKLPRVSAVVLAACTVAASAEEPNDRYWVRLEGFVPKISSTARFDLPGTRIAGTTVDFERDLGLSDQKTLPYVLMGLRLGERWRAEFEYYELKRTGTRTIQRDVQWDDTVFSAGAEITSNFDSTIFRLSAGYSFYRSSTGEMGAAFGFHVTDFDLGITGQGTVPQGELLRSESKQQVVPLPTLGLYGTYMLSPQWILRGRLDYLSLKYDQYDGALVNVMAAVDWRFARNFAIGLGYRYVHYDVKASKSSFDGEVKYKFRGPTLYLEAAF